MEIGEKVNRWTVIGGVEYKTFPSGVKAKTVLCQCDCGTVKVLRLGSLTSPNHSSMSCGCYHREVSRSLRYVPPVGTTYGRLTVTGDFGMIPPEGGKGSKNYVLVVCSCGSPENRVRVDQLKDGNTMSCGCLQKDKASEFNKTHGLSDTTAYSSWQGMKDRCTNPSNSRWLRYGGRGISYPLEWETFEGFWGDMNPGWFSGADIDRIDFDGNYALHNCRWVNRDIGNHNKSKPTTCTSKYKGVYFDKDRDKWTARLNRNGVIYLQKRFNTELSAAIAYDNISEEVYGDRPNKTLKQELNNE